jgi:hypothetical protein
MSFARRRQGRVFVGLAPVGLSADQSGFEPYLEATAFRRWSLHTAAAAFVYLQDTTYVLTCCVLSNVRSASSFSVSIGSKEGYRPNEAMMAELRANTGITPQSKAV